MSDAYLISLFSSFSFSFLFLSVFAVPWGFSVGARGIFLTVWSYLFGGCLFLRGGEGGEFKEATEPLPANPLQRCPQYQNSNRSTLPSCSSPPTRTIYSPVAGTVRYGRLLHKGKPVQNLLRRLPALPLSLLRSAE